MGHSAQLLIFHLDRQRYAIPLERVNRVVRAAEITPLPGAPGIVLGVLDIQGHVLPVLSLRQRFGLTEKSIAPTDHFLLARTGRREVALVIDRPEDVLELSDQKIAASSEILPGLDHIQGVAALDDGVILIQNLDRLLSLEEETALDEAIEKEVSRAG